MRREAKFGRNDRDWRRIHYTQRDSRCHSQLTTRPNFKKQALQILALWETDNFSGNIWVTKGSQRTSQMQLSLLGFMHKHGHMFYQSVRYTCLVFAPQPITVAVRSMAQVCSRLIAGIDRSNPDEGTHVYVLCSFCVCVDSGLCDELITRSEESYRVCVPDSDLNCQQ